jgi:hypothetical protein
VNSVELERQLTTLLTRIHVPKRFLELGLQHLAVLTERDLQAEHAVTESLEKSLAAANTQLTNLNRMRLNDLIDDAEYLQEKKGLLTEKIRLERKLREGDQRSAEATRKTAALLHFAYTAGEIFRKSSPEAKRKVIADFGSNFSLTDRKLTVQAKKPHLLLEDGLTEIRGNSGPFEPTDCGSRNGKVEPSRSTILRWWALVDDVRTYFLKDPSSDKPEFPADESSSAPTS